MRHDRQRDGRYLRRRRRLTAPAEKQRPMLTPGRVALIVAVLVQAAIVIYVVVLLLTFGRQV